MSRYIDADALEYDTEWSEYHDGFTAYSQLAIDTAPSIDIVRCKECKNYNFYRKQFTMERRGDGLCDRMNCVMNDDDFCSYAERSEE